MYSCLFFQQTSVLDRWPRSGAVDRLVGMIWGLATSFIYGYKDANRSNHTMVTTNGR